MKELRQQWENHEFAPCYLFYGEETYLVKLYEKLLTQAMIPKDALAMNYDMFEEKRATAAVLMDALETMPFLSERRLVVIRRSGFFQKGARKEEGEKLIEYIKNLPESTCALFVEEKVEKNNRLYKAVQSTGKVMEFKRPTEKELIHWIRKQCKSAKLTVSDSVVQLFLQTVEKDMESIESELQKLMAYKEGGGTVLAEDIAQICTPSLEAKVFDLVRMVVEEKPEKALALYRNLLMLKESPYMVLSLISRQFRLILESKLLSDIGKSNQEIAEVLEVRDFAVREYIRQAKRFPTYVWRQSMEDCLQVDVDIKSGIMGEEIAVELLLMKYSRKQKVAY